ncbi:hypothetical protein VPH35_132781 [Triticum aestivum]
MTARPERQHTQCTSIAQHLQHPFIHRITSIIYSHTRLRYSRKATHAGRRTGELSHTALDRRPDEERGHLRRHTRREEAGVQGTLGDFNMVSKPAFPKGKVRRIGPPPDQKMKSMLPEMVFTKPAPRRTTMRSSSPPVVHFIMTFRSRRRHGACHDAALTVEIAKSVSWRPMPWRPPPLITVRRRRRVAGARLHQARAMDADAIEVDAPEVDTTGGRPHSSPFDEDDASPELIFTKPALWTLTPSRSMPWRSTPRMPPLLITAQRRRRVAGACFHQAGSIEANSTLMRLPASITVPTPPRRRP